MFKVQSQCPPQLGSCTLSGRARRPRAARHSQGGPWPLGSQPRPQVLERADSKVAHFTAFDRVGSGKTSPTRPKTIRRRSGGR